MHAFVELLRAEQHSLVYGEIERLVGSADVKAKSLLELARLGERRQRLLDDAGVTLDRTGTALREHAGRAPQLSAEWQLLMSLTQTAHQLNVLNGTLIATRLRSTQQALNALLSAARIPGTYTPEGSIVSLRPGTQLAVA